MKLPDGYLLLERRELNSSNKAVILAHLPGGTMARYATWLVSHRDECHSGNYFQCILCASMDFGARVRSYGGAA